MYFLPEIIIIVVLFSGIIIYIRKNSPARKSEKLKVLKNYRRTQNLSMKLQDTISTHILKHDAFNEEITPGKTYGDYLKQLQQEHMAKLSEAAYLKLRSSYSDTRRRKAIKLLEKETKRLCDAKKKLEPISNTKRPA